jgi:putative spermidine/putrescine transport system permease protein
MRGLPIGLRVLAHASAGVVLAFLMLPILAVLPASLNDASFISLPPEAVSLRWYRVFFADPEWRAALVTSVEMAVVVTIVSLVLGTTVALGLERLPDRLRTAITGLFLAPLIVPSIVSAVAIYRSALDVGLSGTFVGLSLGHVVLALPFVLINVGISLRSVDRFWLRAAAGLGANQWTVFRTIVLPHIVPGLFGGAVFAFITSFDEVVMTIFMAGPRTTTLPVKLWETIRLEFTPVVAVAATLVVLLGFILLVCGQVSSRRRNGAAA